MKIIKLITYSCFGYGLMLGSSACGIQKKATVEKKLDVPAAYPGAADSIDAGNISLKNFFKDPVLIALIDTAINNNPDLQNAMQRIMIARANLVLQKGLRLPSLDGFVSASVDKYGKYTMTGVGNFDTNLSQNIDKDQQVTNPVQDYYFGLKSSWEIDLWGKLKARKTSAQAQLLASEQERKWVITQLVAQVATYYYELLALDNRLEIIYRNIELQERAVEIVKAQMEGGRANALAVQQFTAQLLHTKGLEYETKLSIVQLENEMNVLLGQLAQTPVPRGTAISKQEFPAQVFTGTPADMLARRPDVKQAEWHLAATKADVEVARKSFLPSLVLTPYLALNAFKFPLLFNGSSLAYGILGGLTQPIFNRYQLKSDFAVSNAQQEIAFNEYKLSFLNAYKEVITNIKSIEYFKKIVTLNNDEVETLKQAVSTSNDLYLSAYASYLEVITAQKGVLEAELKQTEARKALLHSHLDLYRSLGGGWE
ncbi:MAG: efflux transporter outer membrane subunit [Agriterribacter sp.]